MTRREDRPSSPGRVMNSGNLDGFWDDHYAVLGVSADVDGPELRRAWRRLAIRWHPDRAGARSTPVFQRIADAYAVLADPVARAAYDRGRAASVPGSTRGARASREPSEPRTEEATAAPRQRAPGTMITRLSAPLNALLAGGDVRRGVDGVLELLLTADEVAEGGMVAVPMRVMVRCDTCGVAPGSSCARCGDTGATDALFSAWLAIPPDVADGTLLEPSAQLPGVLRPVRFRVRHPRPGA